MAVFDEVYFKHFFEIFSYCKLHFFHVQLMSQFALQRGDLFILDAAGYDIAEIIEVGVDVKGEAMHGDPPAAAYAYCAYLSFASL